MTTHKERVDMFFETIDISSKINEGVEEIPKYEVLWLLSCFREYIVELDKAYIDILKLKARLDTLEVYTQLNSKQSVIDNKKEDN